MSVLDRALAPLYRRLRLMIARGVIELVDESKKMQTVQVSTLADVTKDDVERFQQYGFSSYPKSGAEALVLHVRGDHPVVVSVDDRRYRPKTLAEGESCMYTLQNGVRVLCKSNGEIHIGTSPTQYAARADHVLSELQALQTNVNTNYGLLLATLTPIAALLNAGGPVIGAPGSVTPYAKVDANSPGSVAADEVKIK